MGVKFLLLTAVVFASAQSLPEGPGKDLVEVICSACHPPIKVLGKEWTKKEWQDKVLEMLQEEADVTQSEKDTIVAYLAKHFPKPGELAKANVNQASAQELEIELEISAKSAESIAKYREDHGPFKSLADLKKVPGLDPAQIDAQKDRLQF